MKIYEERRLKLTENLSGDIAVIIPGSVLANRSNDTAYPFRQDSNFYYLSGFNEPDSTLMIINKSGKTNSIGCLLYTSPSPRDLSTSRMPSSA